MRKTLYGDMSESDQAAVKEYLRRRESEEADRISKTRDRLARKREKEGKRLPAEHPKAVKDFFDATKAYREALGIAIRCAGQGMFAPESLPLIKKRGEAIGALFQELTDCVETRDH